MNITGLWKSAGDTWQHEALSCSLGQQGLPRRAGGQLQSPGEKRTLDPISSQSPTLSRLLCLRVVYKQPSVGILYRTAGTQWEWGGERKVRRRKGEGGKGGLLDISQHRKRALAFSYVFFLFFNFSFSQRGAFSIRLGAPSMIHASLALNSGQKSHFSKPRVFNQYLSSLGLPSTLHSSSMR